MSKRKVPLAISNKCNLGTHSASFKIPKNNYTIPITFSCEKTYKAEECIGNIIGRVVSSSA